jgi:hypothetical protein
LVSRAGLRTNTISRRPSKRFSASGGGGSSSAAVRSPPLPLPLRRPLDILTDSPTSSNVRILSFPYILMVLKVFLYNRHFQRLDSHRHQKRESWQRYKMNCMLCSGFITRIVDFIDRGLRYLVRHRLPDVVRCRLPGLGYLLMVVLEVLKVLGCGIDVIRYLERCHLRKLIMLCRSM